MKYNEIIRKRKEAKVAKEAAEKECRKKGHIWKFEGNYGINPPKHLMKKLAPCHWSFSKFRCERCGCEGRQNAWSAHKVGVRKYSS